MSLRVRLLSVVFFMSGATGLIYQTLWIRQLQRVFGLTVEATATVVAVFMGGLALGAALAGRRARRSTPTARGYAILEIGIGVSALVTTVLLRFLPDIFASVVSDPTSAWIFPLRFALSVVVLLPPVTLMGMTLPFLVVVVAGTAPPGRALATLYALNTLGAVVGVLACGFLFIATLGEARTGLLAAGTNVVLGVLVLLLARDEVRQPPEPSITQPAPPLFLVIAALSGAASLAAEVAWTRILVFLVGSSVYAFALTLASFLVGIAVGSYAWRRVTLDRFAGTWPLIVLATLAAAAIGASLFVIELLGSLTTDPVHNYAPLQRPADVVLFFGFAVAVVLPTTILLGALFPAVAAAAGAERKGLTGQTVAYIAAANTVGAVVGSLAAGFVLIPALSAQGTLVFAATLYAACALTIAIARHGLRSRATAIAVAGVAVVSLLQPRADVVRDLLAKRLAPGQDILKHIEDIDVTVTVIGNAGGGPELHLNGVTTSGAGRGGMLMADIPLLLQENPRRALVICLGAGSAFRQAVRHLRAVDAKTGAQPGVSRVDLVELSRAVIGVNSYFQESAEEFLHAPDVRVFVDDGRNFALLSRDVYDLVVVDGTPPIHAAGMANLYSQEMFELVRARLSDDGVYMLWVPGTSYADDIWSIVHAAQVAMPHVIASVVAPGGIMILSSKRPLDVREETIARRLAERHIDGSYLSPRTVVVSFIDAQGLAPAAQVEALRDDRPRTEYPLGDLLRGRPIIVEPAALFAR